jgi:hypothetical protein
MELFLLTKLSVGRHLWKKVNNEEMQNEAKEIMSGLIGYFVGQYLTHPAIGDRFANVEKFAAEAELS